MINKTETTKIIGIGENGVVTLDKISDKVRNTMEIDKIFPNQDVDKDYVRELLDGVDVLYLVYDSEDKASLQIVNAIGYMAEERRVLSIGLDTATKENKDNVNLNREFKLNEDNENEILNLFNIMLEAIGDDCDIAIDITDLKEIVASDKGLKYTYKEFTLDLKRAEIADKVIESLTCIGDEFTDKKELIMIEASEKITIIELNEILEPFSYKAQPTCDILFSYNIKPELNDIIKIGLILN